MPAPGAPPRARRRFGQNFLVDSRAVARIVAAAAPEPGVPLLEIGPGRGALTGALARLSPLVAVEMDRDLAAFVRARFEPDRVALVEDDILRYPIAETASRLGLADGTPARVVGNLPYNISKPVALKLVRERGAIGRAVLMFQREVADRLTASPGGKDYGPLSVLAGLAFRIDRLFDLPPRAFRPAPKVTSTVTLWTPRPADSLSPELEAPLMRVLAAAFARRRRTILGNLRETPEMARTGDAESGARALLERAAIDPGARAETVRPGAFLELARIWPGRAAC